MSYVAVDKLLQETGCEIFSIRMLVQRECESINFIQVLL